MRQILNVPLKKALLILALVCIYLVTTVLVYRNLYTESNKGYISDPETPSAEVYRDITDDTVLEQWISCTQDNFSGFGIKFFTFNRRVDSNIRVTLHDAETMEIVKTWNISTFEIFNMEYHNFYFDNIGLAKGHNYIISLRYPRVDENNYVAPMYTSNAQFMPFSTFKSNGEEVPGVLSVRPYYIKSGADNMFNFGTLIYIIVSMVLALLAFLLKKNLCRAFFPIAIVLGLLYMLTTPMFRAQDEDLHFYRAYEVSEGHMISDSFNDIGGRTLPASVSDIVRPNVSDIKYSDTIANFDKKLDTHFSKFTAFPNSALYSPLVYFPQAAGIWVARHFNLGPMYMAYFGRFFNLLVWALLMNLAIRVMYFARRMLFFLALSPMSLYTASSLSADAMTNSITILFIAFVISLACGKVKRVAPWHIIVLVVLSAAGSLCKNVYLPLSLIFLIIPRGKFKKTWHKWAIFFLMVLIAAGINVWWLGIAARFRIDQINVGTHTPMQINNVIENPINFLLVMSQTMARFFNFYLQSFFGASLGWFDIPIYTWISVVNLLIVWFIAFADNRDEIELGWDKKWILLGVIAMILGLIFASLYAVWTRVGYPVIEGVQGRYFAPIMPLILLLFRSNSIKSTISDEMFNFYIAAAAILLQVPVLSTVLIFHI